MTQHVRNILLLTLRVTFGKLGGRKFRPSKRSYGTQRGRLPWETCPNKADQKLKPRCKCLPQRPDKNLRPECEELADDPLRTRGKTYPMIQVVAKKPIPGAPVPSWEEIQKTSPKKPDSC